MTGWRACPHTRQDKRRAEKNTPPPLEGGGWGEGSVQRTHAPTSPPDPLPQGEGECQFSQLGAYPDAYGAAPLAFLRHREIASNRNPVVRGPKTAMIRNTRNIAPATKLNTPIVP